jgi:hypothetical protein
MRDIHIDSWKNPDFPPCDVYMEYIEVNDSDWISRLKSGNLFDYLINVIQPVF